MIRFFVHRDSRLEVLAERLVEALQRERPANPLAAQTVVVAHPGLGRWLRHVIAREQGIAANLHFPQPWQWLERAAQHALGDVAADDGAWRREFLRWRIYAALPGIDEPVVRASLAGADADLRRFRLAERLAGLYAQYLIYRPDWIVAWERGKDAGDWQAALWRSLRTTIAASHRAQRQRELLEALARAGDGATGPLHVFGVTHLPPDTLDALIASSEHRAVHLYFPDPCGAYWADMRTPRALLERGDDADALYFEIGHPLLVSLGRMTQDFLLALDARGIEFGADEVPLEAEPTTLLGALQMSLRDCEPQRVGAAPALRTDASLRVHACATRLRELEVLRDALLRFLADNGEWQPRDIVVMAPDIGAYAPLLPAVFGPPAHYSHDRSSLPWHLADVNLASAHPLSRAFAQLLELAESRFGLSEVLDLLAVPALARRAHLHTDDRARLERRMRSAGVAWGLDARAKQQAGAAAVAANSWQFGFDRLFAGLIAGEDTGHALLDGILPLALPGSDDAAALGRLHQFVESLRRLAAGFAVPRTLAAWCAWLHERIDALFEADPGDAGEYAALDALRRVLVDLRAQDEARARQLLPWSVMREALRGALTAVPEHQPFLLGGVTFCGLVPQRSIPFRVVCLVGMNEGEFPRPGGDEGLNRMLGHPRRGDRDTRREDRQLFLDALIAARERLHISFLGRDVENGKTRNPAAPLAELLQFLDERHGIAGDVDKVARPWRIEHALQPHAAKYYDGADPALFSFAGAYVERRSAPDAVPPFADWTPARDAAPVAGTASLRWLKRFWRDPAMTQLRDDAGVSLSALDDDESLDREPLQSKAERRERVESRLLFDALAAGQRELPLHAPDWLALSGRIASGAIGASAYARARQLAQTALGAAREILGGAARREAQFVELDCGGVRVSGTVQDTFRCSDGKLRLFGARLGKPAEFAQLLPFYLDWACLRLGGAAIDDAHFVEADKDCATAGKPKLLAAILVQSDAQLRYGLHELLRMALESRVRPVLFPPRTAWAWAGADPARRLDKAARAWAGEDGNTGERDYAPGYAALLARGTDFLDADTPSGREFAATVAHVLAILNPATAANGVRA